MDDLTDAEISFLRQQEISINSIFNARGMSFPEWREIMKNEDRLFAYNTSACKNAGHKLRDRSNHCIQCRTSNIAFTRRSSASGIIYVFASSKLKLLKVGVSSDPAARQKTVNDFFYGGTNDWQKIAQLSVIENAGREEFRIHSALARYAAPQEYTARGRRARCLEIFACSYRTVKGAIGEVLGGDALARITEVPNCSERFNFHENAS